MAKPYTIFMLLKAQRSFLSLTPSMRNDEVKKIIKPVLQGHPDVRLRFYDVEHLSAISSDVAVWETENLPSWFSIVEKLRETRFWDDYFAVQTILSGLEQGFVDHYGVAAL